MKPEIPPVWSIRKQLFSAVDPAAPLAGVTAMLMQSQAVVAESASSAHFAYQVSKDTVDPFI